MTDEFTHPISSVMTDEITSTSEGSYVLYFPLNV